MAGDWIKMRTNLDGDPRVIELASALNLPELHIVGCLWKLWAWANDHSIDGNAIRVTGVTLDRYTSVPGFADALRNVGWLEGRDTALTFPRFAEHNGQTAKKRAETKERVAKSRNAKRVTDVTQKVLPEKRREEKRRVIGSKEPITYTSEFLQFWELYPRRQGSPPQGKADAFEQWRKLLPEDIPKVMVALSHYTKSCNGYPKDPERFLKKDFWKDHLTPPTAVASYGTNKPRNGPGQLFDPSSVL